MATFEPRAIDDMPSTTEDRSAIITMLSTDIETLTVLKDTLQAAHITAVFESIIGILTLVRVSLVFVFPSLHSLIGHTPGRDG